MDSYTKKEAAWLILELIDELKAQLEAHEDPAFCYELQVLGDIEARYSAYCREYDKARGPLICFLDKAEEEKIKEEVQKVEEKYQRDFMTGAFQPFFRPL